MPEVTVFRDGTTFKLIVQGFEEPLICKQLVTPGTTLASPKANPEPASPTQPIFPPDVPLEKLIPSSQQKDVGLQKLSSEEKNKLRLYILNLCNSAYALGAKQSVGLAEVRPTPSPLVIEGQLEGESEGFSGETIFQLTNGQIWKQTHYYYQYLYAYRQK